jgi:hypothetical protein
MGSERKDLSKAAGNLSELIGRYRTADFDLSGSLGGANLLGTLGILQEDVKKIQDNYPSQNTLRLSSFGERLDVFNQQQLARARLNRVPSPDDLDEAQALAKEAKVLASRFAPGTGFSKAITSTIFVIPALMLLSLGFYSTPSGMITAAPTFNSTYVWGFLSGLVVAAAGFIGYMLIRGKHF